MIMATQITRSLIIAVIVVYLLIIECVLFLRYLLF
jgi:hypothetical protein